jgi:hypothetical protein
VESRVPSKGQARFGGERTHAPKRCDGAYPTLSQGFLALIALYHNTRPLPKRGNKTPLQLAGVDLGDDDWVRLLEHEMCYGQAAQKI